MGTKITMPLEQPQSIRTIFFDAGFTLLRPFPSVLEICQQVCRQLGPSRPYRRSQALFTHRRSLFFRQSRLNLHTWANEQAISEFWLGYYMTFLRPFVEEHDEPRLYQLALAINQEFEKHTVGRPIPMSCPLWRRCALMATPSA